MICPCNHRSRAAHVQAMVIDARFCRTPASLRDALAEGVQKRGNGWARL